MSGDEAHSWARARFAARATGLLSPEVEERVGAHLAACPACQRLWDEYAGEQPHDRTDADHLPTSLIAHWSQAPQILRGLARDMVRAHLERCPACRADLQLLGHTDPVAQLDAATQHDAATQLDATAAQLDATAALPSAMRGGRPAADSVRPAVARPRDQDVRRLAWWGLGGWAVLATAAAVMLAVLPRAERSGPRSSFVLPWVTPALVRGAGGEAVLEVPAGGLRAIVAVAIPVGTPAASTAQIQIFAPGDVLLVSMPVSAQELQRRTVMVQLDLPPQAPLGLYRVVVVAQPPGGPAPVERFFEVRAAAR